MRAIQRLLYCVVLLSTVTLVSAQQSVYLATDLGLNVASDVDTSVPATGGGSFSGTTEFDPGFRLGAAIGSRFGPWLAIELESGFLYNPISRSQSWIGNLPLLGNIVLRYENESGWIPYIGGGAGGSLLLVTIEEDGVEEDDSDLAIAWQGFAGIRYKVSERFAIGIGYKYLQTTETKFTIRNSEVDLEETQNHSFGVTFTWDF